jgi:dihydroneopterin aldolase
MIPDADCRGGGKADDRAAIRLAISGIEFEGGHGVYAEERERGNRFSVDVEMGGDFAAGIHTDNLADTVDYDAIVQRVCDVNRRQTFHLIESLAGAVADELLDRFARICEIRVRVRKVSLRHLGSNVCATAEVTKRRT